MPTMQIATVNTQYTLSSFVFKYPSLSPLDQKPTQHPHLEIISAAAPMASSKNFVVTCLLVTCLVVSSVEGYDFLVGGRNGWVLKPSEGYGQWSGRMRFQVNDTLVFKYNSGTDSVLVVNKDGFDTCNTGNPILKLEGGDSRYKFERSGPFYFITGNQTNCQNGQKLIVVVMSPRSKTPSPPPPSSPTPSPAPPPGSESPTPTPTPTPSPSSTPTPTPEAPSSTPTPEAPSSTPTPTPTPTPEAPSSTPTPSSTPPPAPEGSPPGSEPPSGGSGGLPPSGSGGGTGGNDAAPPSSSTDLKSSMGIGFGCSILVMLVLGSFLDS